MDCSRSSFPVHHQLPELAQTHVHQVGDTIQPSCSLSSPSPPALNLSQHQGLSQGVSSSHQVAKVLELQYQSFQWIFKVDFLLWLFSNTVVSHSLRHHGLQYARIPCPSPSPKACSNSYPLSWWYYPTISSSVIPFSSCIQSFPVSGSFPGSQFFTSGG